MSRHFANTIRFIILFGILTAVLTLTAQAAPTAQDAPRPRFGIETIPQLPIENEEQSENAQLSVTAPNIILPWSKIAFQSLRNGNWDIFIGNDDGSGQTGVATTGHSEIHPHLNRGNTRVVYASNSGGDYEIYTMNADGSGKTALTNNSSSDGNPSWSPDGSKIVFEAYRNGQPDIYVMNANGTNQTRLTTHADFDGMPSWSPDGSKIAFVSRRTGGYRIYVMNADGSGKIQISNQPYSLRPQWSPDGNQIAFDADSDGDGWQDLWRMNADGSGQSLVYNPSGQTDAWASSWSPDGKRIAYTLISFIQYNGSWYWTNAYLDAWGTNLGTIRLSSQGKDWDASWQTNDNSPPVASLAPLPLFQSGSPQIAWSGVDYGNSGLATFDVQYRNTNSEVWTMWQDSTPLTKSTFTGQAGETYIFRVRAKDAAYNFSNWQLAPGNITLYTWGIGGKIIDNVGNPIQNASIFTSPGAFFGESSLDSGQYATYVAQTNSTYDVQWSKTGYGSLPLTTYTETPTENVTDIMLPPANNVVQDSGFESNNIALDAVWETDSTYTEPSLTIYKHTGSFGARMGYDRIGGPSYYTPNEQLFYNADFDNTPQIAFSPTQQAHVVWRNYETGDIYHAEQLSDEIWSTPIRVSENTTDDTSNEQIQVDDNGGVHVAWHQDGEVFYTWRPSGGNWTAPAILTDIAPGAIIMRAVLIYHGNEVSLVFFKGDYSLDSNSIYSISRGLDSSWSPYETIATGLKFGQFYVDSDGSGNLHVSVGPGYNWPAAYYWQKSLSSSWTQAQNIPLGTGTDQSEMIVAENGEVHFISWAYDHAIYHTRRSVSGNWSSNHIITNQHTQHYHPKAILTESNGLHIVWTVYPIGQPDDDLGLYYAHRSGNGQWTAPIKISSLSGQRETAIMFLKGVKDHSYLFFNVFNENVPSYTYYFCVISPTGEWYEPSRVYTNEYKFGTVAFAEDGVLHSILYQGNGSGLGLYHDDFQFRDDEYSSLSQVITITDTIHNPYLSFMYKMSGGNSDTQAGLQLIVDDGATQSIAAELYDNEATWEPASIDFSPWLGKTVTATWRINQVSGTLPVYLILDDISVGSAYPDLWLEASGPPTALSDDQVAYTLLYGNQSPIAVSDAEISISLPESLQFVSSVPAPTITSPNLRWNVGDLQGESGPFKIVLTLQVSAAAPKLTNIQFSTNIQTTNSELEEINNQVINSLFIGRITYLPIVRR